jgi:hypothetical protein
VARAAVVLVALEPVLLALQTLAVVAAAVVEVLEVMVAQAL